MGLTVSIFWLQAEEIIMLFFALSTNFENRKFLQLQKSALTLSTDRWEWENGVGNI